MRILITGDRFWPCNNLASAILLRLVARYGPDIVIVHGGATGVDESFDTAPRGHGIAVEAHPVADEDWDRLSKAAGPIRNQEMVDAGAEMCIAFHRAIGASRGTRGNRRFLPPRYPWLTQQPAVPYD
jgi:hypothetical protein